MNQREISQSELNEFRPFEELEQRHLFPKKVLVIGNPNVGKYAQNSALKSNKIDIVAEFEKTEPKPLRIFSDSELAFFAKVGMTGVKREIWDKDELNKIEKLCKKIVKIIETERQCREILKAIKPKFSDRFKRSLNKKNRT